MSDFPTALSEIRRPGILMRAVRFALADYHRPSALKRFAPEEKRPEGIVSKLFETEAMIEKNRQSGSSAYSILTISRCWWRWSPRRGYWAGLRADRIGIATR